MRAVGRHAGSIIRIDTAIGLLLAIGLLGYGIHALLPLRGQAEQAMVMASIGAMRATLGGVVAQTVVRDGQPALLVFEGSNPVELLARPPRGYAGAFEHVDAATLAPGAWAFDRARGVLLYRIGHPQYFTGNLTDPPRLEWRIELVFAGGVREAERLRAVLLQPRGDGRWVLP